MPLAERRRLGGARRGQSARAMHTPHFGSPFREDFERWKMRASAPFGRGEPPRRRRSYCIVTAEMRPSRTFFSSKLDAAKKPRRLRAEEMRGWFMNRAFGRDADGESSNANGVRGAAFTPLQAGKGGRPSAVTMQ